MNLEPPVAQTVPAAVIDVIRNDFHDDFMDVYALTIALVDKHPEQANNEIRNALNHLARALEAPTNDVATEQIQKARDHIERAKRDCLKIAIINRSCCLSDMAARLQFRDGILPEAVRTRIRKLRSARQEALLSEARGDAKTTEHLSNILADFLDFEKELETSHHVPGATLTNLRRWVYRLWRWVGNLSAMLIMTAVVYLLIPDTNAVKKYVGMMMDTLAPTSRLTD